MMKQSFTIPGRLASLNDYTSSNRTNQFAGAKMKRAQTETCVAAIRAAKLVPMIRPINVHIKWYEPNRKRDHDNVAFAKKFILDALVATGVIQGDGWNFVRDFTDQFYESRTKPRIKVTIEEVYQIDGYTYKPGHKAGNGSRSRQRAKTASQRPKS